MQSEFRRDISLEQKVTGLVFSLLVSVAGIYVYGPKVLELAQTLIEGSGTAPETLNQYFLLFFLIFITSFFPIASILWIVSLFDRTVILRIDENGVFYRPEFRETGAYEVVPDDDDFEIAFEVDEPERFLKSAARRSGKGDPGKASLSTRGLDASPERIRDLFEQRWRESRA